jgi:hypothetical protein
MRHLGLDYTPRTIKRRYRGEVADVAIPKPWRWEAQVRRNSLRRESQAPRFLRCGYRQASHLKYIQMY